VRQVVLNLADNAIKFTGQGKVKISVEAAEQTANEVVLHFTVSDTGIGIAPDKLTGIFDRFYQADSSMTRRYGGSGLGLAIVAQLVKAMLGSVWAESEPQAGSVFHFTIRCEIGENPQRNLMHPVEEGSGGMSLQGLRVLLVEDSAVNQLVAREVLRRHGCDVMVASNGKEAVETVQSHAFDLILMDLQMPEMDGFEATRLIRQQKQFATIPIIAQTAHAFPQDIERCLGAGMDGHIAKPITPSGLLKVLSEHRDGLRQPQKPDHEASNSTLDGAQLTKRKLSGIDDLVGRLSDDKERAAQIIDMFLEVVPSQMADLDLAVLVGDCKAIGGLAHTIKGSFMSFGARELADLTMEIEKAAENDDLGSITVLTGRVNRQFAAFQEEVRRIRRELSP